MTIVWKQRNLLSLSTTTTTKIPKILLNPKKIPKIKKLPKITKVRKNAKNANYFSSGRKVMSLQEEKKEKEVDQSKQ